MFTTLARSMWLGYWPNSFLRSMDQKEIEFHRNAEKKKKKEGGQNPPSWPNKFGQQHGQKNRFNKNQEWLVSFKKATCVYSTVNPCESFMFSLYWLSSAVFCDSPDRRHCPKVASFVRRSTQLSSCAGSKRVVPSGQAGPHCPLR